MSVKSSSLLMKAAGFLAVLFVVNLLFMNFLKSSKRAADEEARAKAYEAAQRQEEAQEELDRQAQAQRDAEYLISQQQWRNIEPDPPIELPPLPEEPPLEFKPAPIDFNSEEIPKIEEFTVPPRTLADKIEGVIWVGHNDRAWQVLFFEGTGRQDDTKTYIAHLHFKEVDSSPWTDEERTEYENRSWPATRKLSTQELKFATEQGPLAGRVKDTYLEVDGLGRFRKVVRPDDAYGNY